MENEGLEKKTSLKLIAESMNEDNQQGDSNNFRVFLFFSFDLSDSTEFKTEHPDLWSIVFTSFYTIMMRDLQINSGGIGEREEDENIYQRGMKLWKLIGDEILVYVAINKWSELYPWIRRVDDIIKRAMSEVAEEVICVMRNEKEGKETQYNIDSDKVKNIIKHNLGIKGTAWIAAFDLPDSDFNPNTIYNPPFDTEGQAGTDFLGRDIDEGFRVAKFAEKDRLLIAPLLAWLIYKSGQEENTKDEEDFRITSYVELKGVWKRRKVPLILYHYKFDTLEEKLAYDDIDKEIYKNIKNLGFKKFISDEKMQLKYIDNIMNSVHRKEEANCIYETLKRRKSVDAIDINRDMVPKHELHIACVVFTESGEVLVHSDDGRWEYGSAKYIKREVGDTWKQICENEYLERYLLPIEVSETPTPFATYNFKREDNRNVLGVLIIGMYKGHESDLPKDWEIADEEKIKQYNKNAQPEFLGNYQKAKKVFNEYMKERI